jgi:hypothetical protein
VIATVLCSFNDGETFSLLRLTGPDVTGKDGAPDGVATLAAFTDAEETTGGTEVLDEYLAGHVRSAIMQNLETFADDRELIRSLIYASSQLTIKDVQRDDA